jgi:thioredoxin reductase (NADPH)
MLIPAKVVGVECSSATSVGAITLMLADQRRIRARTVVVATGAHYRRPDLAELPAFEGRGVWYWASPIEAKICAEQDVVLVGGGNSAGQAAVYLSAHAAKVTMLVRGEGLAATMSRYLIDRIQSAPNIELLACKELSRLEGSAQAGLEHVSWRDRQIGAVEGRAVLNLVLYIGDEPETTFLADSAVELDGAGFIVTGKACARSGSAPARAPLESSIAGIFAVGDVRSGSVKRVGGAIGEGAAVVASIHEHLARLAPAPA